LLAAVTSSFPTGIQINEVESDRTNNQLNSALNERFSSLVVDVSVTHPDTSELIITLISPDNRRVILHNRRSGVNLRTSYPTLSVPAESLSLLNGNSVSGTWTLELYDAVLNTNKGTLDKWTLNFYQGLFVKI
jgi:subtilisin-like proprotein convertase family protein